MEYKTIGDVVKQVKAASNALFEKQTQFLADIIAIRSYTGHETPAVERTLKELKAIGCEETWMDTAGNALGKIGHGKKLILYNAHLDTNEVADEKEWPHPPLQPTIENGAMWGLGASDCKGGVAAIVYGAAILKALHLEGDFTLLVMGATLEEDAEGFALRSLVERDGLKPDVVLLAEATDLSLRRGQRGRCEIQVHTKGKAAHASQPQFGDNAILKMLPVMQALEAMNPGLPENPIFGKGNQVISMIQGPHTPNSVPSWCEVTIDRRMVPGETMDSILNGIRAVVEPLGATAQIPDQVVKTHTGQRLDGPSFYPGWLLEEDHPLISAGFRTCKTLWGKAPELDVWHFSTDGTYSAGIAGIPTLGFGPEEEKYVHAANDQVNLEKLRKAAEFYALFPLMIDGD
ncbi:MAG: YgeY family selenium metabolism-linked hydrolase [Anaerolineaceae bacterium]|nr:YgeY family selenium metabolism-linked hydrolase [Anaerolineaceae bacterium]